MKTIHFLTVIDGKGLQGAGSRSNATGWMPCTVPEEMITTEYDGYKLTEYVELKTNHFVLEFKVIDDDTFYTED